jgi:hypothetical protein
VYCTMPRLPSSGHDPARVIAIASLSLIAFVYISMAIYCIAIGLYSIFLCGIYASPGTYQLFISYITLSRARSPQPRPHPFFSSLSLPLFHNNPPAILPPSLSDIAASDIAARQSHAAQFLEPEQQSKIRSRTASLVAGCVGPRVGGARCERANTTESQKCQSSPKTPHASLLLCCPAQSSSSIRPPDWPRPPVTHGSDSARRVS